MATLNGIKIFVKDESIDRTTEQTSHPVEKGIELTDSIRNKPVVLSLSGKIVDTDTMTAKEIEDKIEKLRTSGSLIEYAGRNVLSNMQIQDFYCDYNNKNWGGASFSMTLKEVRIAKSSYKSADKSKQQAAAAAQQKNAPTLKVGAIVVFKGGSVYASSDAKKAAANRGRSTCKITIITTKGIHQYHLISTDGGKVYGWVDKAKIEGTGSTSSGTKTNAGTQQVTGSKKGAVYHSVKKGDTVYKLATVTYKELGKSVQWIIDNNSACFTKPKDPTTLKIGSKLLVGYKE